MMTDEELRALKPGDIVWQVLPRFEAPKRRKVSTCLVGVNMFTTTGEQACTVDSGGRGWFVEERDAWCQVAAYLEARASERYRVANHAAALAEQLEARASHARRRGA